MKVIAYTKLGLAYVLENSLLLVVMAFGLAMLFPWIIFVAVISAFANASNEEFNEVLNLGVEVYNDIGEWTNSIGRIAVSKGREAVGRLYL